MKSLGSLAPAGSVSFRMANCGEVLLLLQGTFDGATISLKIDPTDVGSGHQQLSSAGTTLQWTAPNCARILLPGPAHYKLEMQNTGAGAVDAYLATL